MTKSIYFPYHKKSFFVDPDQLGTGLAGR